MLEGLGGATGTCPPREMAPPDAESPEATPVTRRSQRARPRQQESSPASSTTAPTCPALAQAGFCRPLPRARPQVPPPRAQGGCRPGGGAPARPSLWTTVAASLQPGPPRVSVLTPAHGPHSCESPSSRLSSVAHCPAPAGPPPLCLQWPLSPFWPRHPVWGLPPLSVLLWEEASSARPGTFRQPPPGLPGSGVWTGPGHAGWDACSWTLSG